MKTQQLKDFRRAILFVLDAAGPRRGLTTEAIVHNIQRFGFRPDVIETERELLYLAGKPLELAELVPAGGFSPEVRCWRLTTAGRNFVAEEDVE